jgi:hypothetical protein
VTTACDSTKRLTVLVQTNGAAAVAVPDTFSSNTAPRARSGTSGIGVTV